VQWEIWQKGFSEDRILDQESCVQHKLYINNNAVQAGLAQTAEDSLLFCISSKIENCEEASGRQRLKPGFRKLGSA
jgi:hypothetical protein